MLFPRKSPPNHYRLTRCRRSALLERSLSSLHLQVAGVPRLRAMAPCSLHRQAAVTHFTSQMLLLRGGRLAPAVQLTCKSPLVNNFPLLRRTEAAQELSESHTPMSRSFFRKGVGCQGSEAALPPNPLVRAAIYKSCFYECGNICVEHLPRNLQLRILAGNAR